MENAISLLLTILVFLIALAIPFLFMIIGDQLFAYLNSQHQGYIYMFKAVCFPYWVEPVIVAASSLILTYSLASKRLKVSGSILIILLVWSVIVNTSSGTIEQDGVLFVSPSTNYATQKILWTEVCDVTLDIDHSSGGRTSKGISYGTLNIKANNKSVEMVFIIERTRQDEWESLIKVLSFLQQNGIHIRLTGSENFDYLDAALLARLRTFSSL